MYHFQKWLGFAIFCDFDTCHKEITIHSLFGSPCMCLFVSTMNFLHIYYLVVYLGESVLANIYLFAQYLSRDPSEK